MVKLHQALHAQKLLTVAAMLFEVIEDFVSLLDEGPTYELHPQNRRFLQGLQVSYLAATFEFVSRYVAHCAGKSLG